MHEARLKRLIDGFDCHEYKLVCHDERGHFYEFRKPDTALRFVVRGIEGGVVLFWTELDDYDLTEARTGKIFQNMPPDVRGGVFSDSLKFWRTVAEVVNGQK